MSKWDPGSFFVSGLIPQQQGTNAARPAAAAGGRPGQATQAAPSNGVNNEWRRWVAENVLLRNTPQSMLDAMVARGIDAQTAAREIQAAMDHPYLLAARQVGKGGADGGTT